MGSQGSGAAGGGGAIAGSDGASACGLAGDFGRCDDRLDDRGQSEIEAVTVCHAEL